MGYTAPAAGRFTAGIDYNIGEVTETDVDELTAVMAEATEYDIIYRFFFSPNREECVAQMRAAYRDHSIWMIREPQEAGWSKFVKAVHTESKKILGWGLIRSRDAVGGQSEGGSEKLTLKPETDPRLESCLQFYQQKLERKYRSVMIGKGDHSVWQALYVLPAYQRKGIGTALVKWAFDAYSLGEQQLYLQTVSSMMPFYYGMGWREVGITEVDLSHWGGEGMGYGVYRTVHMLRPPSGRLRMGFD